MKTIRIISIVLLLFISFKSYAVVHVIKQSGTAFSPTELTVNVGDIVRWEWSDGTHTTTSKTIPTGAGTWDSPLTAANTSFEYTVTEAGKYDYVCTPHEAMGMKGTFTAQIASAANESASIANLSLYPNPASSFINVASTMKGELLLSNILGEKIKTFSFKELSYINDSYKIDLSDLSSGIYFITLIPSDAKNRLSVKFIKK